MVVSSLGPRFRGWQLRLSVAFDEPCGSSAPKCVLLQVQAIVVCHCTQIVLRFRLETFTFVDSLNLADSWVPRRDLCSVRHSMRGYGNLFSTPRMATLPT